MVETRPLCKRELAKTALAATFDALVRPAGRRRKSRSAPGLSLESPPLLASPLLPPAAGVDSPSFSAPPHIVSSHLVSSHLVSPHLASSLVASPFPVLSLSSSFSDCSADVAPRVLAKPALKPCAKLRLSYASANVSVEWIGHATTLISMNGVHILTDPVFSERVGVRVFGKTIGIERYAQAARTLESLPKPDIILLSHAHFDHADAPTLQRFAALYPGEIHLVTAVNTRDVADGLAWKSVTELDWDEEISLEGISVRGLEVRHNGWRLPWDRDRASGDRRRGRSYNAYALTGGGKKVVFGGDTAYTPLFSGLKDERVHLAIMPIGAYQGYESLHCTPEQALQMASEMGAEYFAPIHCGTFDQSEEHPLEPFERMFQAARRHGYAIAWRAIGERFALPA